MFTDALEDSGVVGGEFGEDLAVELEAILLQLRDEGGVGLVAVLADGGVEPDDPELAEVGLFVPSVREGIAASTHQRLVRSMQLLRADATVALGALEDILATLVGMDSTFDSCHTKMISKLITWHPSQGGSGHGLLP